MVTKCSVHSLVTRHCTPIHSNPQNDLGTQGRMRRKLMTRVRASMCGPHFEAGQQEGVFDDYRTVVGRIRRRAFSASSASRGETLSTTGTTIIGHPS